MIRKLLGIAIATATIAPAAGAVDLTGTWEGTTTCQVFNGEYGKTKTSPSVLLVAQTGTTFTAQLDGQLTFNGGVVDSTDKPTLQGEGAMNLCSTDAVPLGGGADEIVRLKLKVNPDKGTGTLSGVSLFGDGGTILACRYKHKRASATAPEVTPCPM